MVLCYSIGILFETVYLILMFMRDAPKQIHFIWHLIDFFCSRAVAFCFVSSLQSKRFLIGYLFLRGGIKFSIDTTGSRANVN